MFIKTVLDVAFGFSKIYILEAALNHVDSIKSNVKFDFVIRSDKGWWC